MSEAQIVEALRRLKPWMESTSKELASYEEAIATGTPLPDTRLPPWQPIDAEQRKLFLSEGIDYEEPSAEDYVMELRSLALWQKKRLASLQEQNIRHLQLFVFRARKELDAAEGYRTRATARPVSLSPAVGECAASTQGLETRLDTRKTFLSELVRGLLKCVFTGIEFVGVGVSICIHGRT